MEKAILSRWVVQASAYSFLRDSRKLPTCRGRCIYQRLATFETSISSTVHYFKHYRIQGFGFLLQNWRSTRHGRCILGSISYWMATSSIQLSLVLSLLLLLYYLQFKLPPEWNVAIISACSLFSSLNSITSSYCHCFCVYCHSYKTARNLNEHIVLPQEILLHPAVSASKFNQISYQEE